MAQFSFWQVLFISFIPAFASAIITYLINSHELKKYGITAPR